MDFLERVPNVVTETQFKELIDSKEFCTEILSTTNAERKAAVWYGAWVLKAINEDGSEEKLLVPSRTSSGQGIRIRVFKTANGLISFLHGLGYTVVQIPLREGEKARM